MATTTNYSWTTPDDTALVKDGAAAIRSLGTSVDTTTKNLNPSTTLGDIEYRSSTANTNSRLGIGSTGQVLTVAGGVPSWATPSTGGGMTLLNTTTLSGSSITISSIPSGYQDLKLVIRDFKPSYDGARCFLRLNNNSGTVYAAIATTDYATSAPNSTIITVAGQVDNSTVSNLSNVIIYDYANSTTWKFVDTLSIGVDRTTNTSASCVSIATGFFDTTAITSLVLLPELNTFTSGTAYLYGVK